MIWLLATIVTRTGLFLSVALWLVCQAWYMDGQVSLAGVGVNVFASGRGVVAIQGASGIPQATINVGSPVDAPPHILMLLEPVDPTAPFAWQGTTPTLTISGITLVRGERTIVLAVHHVIIVTIFGAATGILYVLRERFAAVRDQRRRLRYQSGEDPEE